MIDWGSAWAVVFTGLVVVFAILVVLVFLCWLLGKVMSSAANRKKGGASPKPAAPKQAEAKPAPAPAPELEVEEGIPGEVVAAISAAIACMTGGAKNVAIRGIKRAKGARSAWNAAGVLENTRPF